MNQANKRPLIASFVFLAFVSTFFAGCYYDRDDRWGYDRYSRDYSYDRDRYDHDRYDRDRYRYDRDRYSDRDWPRGRYDRWRDYRDRDDSYSWSRVDPLRSHYND